MTSKKALNSIKNYFDYTKEKEFEIIKKDLDILDILKKYLYDGYDYEYDANVIKFVLCDFKNKEDYIKVSKWLKECQK